MAFGALEIIIIGAVALVFFGWIPKQKWDESKKKFKEIVGEAKEIELDIKDDIKDVEKKVKEERTPSDDGTKDKEESNKKSNSVDNSNSA